MLWSRYSRCTSRVPERRQSHHVLSKARIIPRQMVWQTTVLISYLRLVNLWRINNIWLKSWNSIIIVVSKLLTPPRWFGGSWDCVSLDIHLSQGRGLLTLIIISRFCVSLKCRFSKSIKLFPLFWRKGFSWLRWSCMMELFLMLNT